MTETRSDYGELKPCPFCGGLKSTIEPIFGASFDTPRYCVICSLCGADSQVDLGKSGAVECWNNRPIEDALQAQINDLTARNKHLQWDIEQAERRVDDLARKLDGKA